MIRTGSEYRDSIRDGREVYINGERVNDVTRHPMFKPLVDIRARIYDMAHEPATRDVMCYRTQMVSATPSATSCPRTQQDWHDKRRATDTVMDDIGGIVTRVGDETVGEMWSLYDGTGRAERSRSAIRPQYRDPHPSRAACRSVPRLGQHRSEGRSLQARRRSRTRTCCCMW